MSVIVPAPRGAAEDAPPRRYLGDPADEDRTARELAAGAVVGHGFANFYVITTRADASTVRRVNLLKGRPPNQVGSITVPPRGIPPLFDWEALPPGLAPPVVRRAVDVLYELGPFGFRGPAARHLPDHLTHPIGGVRTAQVIAPGYACPSNDFLARCLETTGDELLSITSANRSRHLTGADDTPAHWLAAGLRAEFGRASGFRLLEHRDETAARAGYPGFLPMSTTILGFHADAGTDERGRPCLTLERHGSLHAGEVRARLDRLGLGLVVARGGGTRLTLREYPEVRP